MVIIFSNILTQVAAKNPRTVAIDGMAASGKSTLADLISKHFDANVIHMDDFFLPFERKTPERLAQPGGNVDYERFIEEVRMSGAFTYHKYSCQTGERTPIKVSPKPLTIVEGAYCLRPDLQKMFDFKIFLYTSPELQEQRILSRNGPEMLKRFQNEWIPLENAYFNAYNIKELCDIIVDTSELF